MTKCRYEIAYRGRCPRVVGQGFRFCPTHTLDCVSCGRAATHSCEVKLDTRVCHLPLCSRCVHMGDSHEVLPDDPTREGMARDLMRTVLERDPAERPRRTVVEDLADLLVELET